MQRPSGSKRGAKRKDRLCQGAFFRSQLDAGTETKSSGFPKASQKEPSGNDQIKV